jgi:hypothetical protein
MKNFISTQAHYTSNSKKLQSDLDLDGLIAEKTSTLYSGELTRTSAATAAIITVSDVLSTTGTKVFKLYAGAYNETDDNGLHYEALVRVTRKANGTYIVGVTPTKTADGSNGDATIGAAVVSDDLVVSVGGINGNTMHFSATLVDVV